MAITIYVNRNLVDELTFSRVRAILLGYKGLRCKASYYSVTPSNVKLYCDKAHDQSINLEKQIALSCATKVLDSIESLANNFEPYTNNNEN